MVDSVLPGSETAFYLNDVCRMWRDAFEARLAAESMALNPSQMRALVYIARYDGQKQKTLADLMNITAMTLSTSLDALEQKGMIRREQDPGDRRASRIWLEPASEAAIVALKPIASETYEKVMNGMNSAQKLALTDALKLMRQNLVA